MDDKTRRALQLKLAKIRLLLAEFDVLIFSDKFDPESFVFQSEKLSAACANLLLVMDDYRREMDARR